MVWDEPSPTITTQFFGYGNGRFGHPEQQRAISLREGAVLQTFPRNLLMSRNCGHDFTRSRRAGHGSSGKVVQLSNDP